MRDSEARRKLRSPETFTPFDIVDCDQAIHCRFEQQAARRPEASAIRLHSGDVTYAQLNAAANRAARNLLETLGSPKRPIGLLMHQGYDSTLAYSRPGTAPWALPVLALQKDTRQID